MLTWVIASPALITGFAVSLMLLRRRGRLAVQLFWAVNAVVAVAALVVLVQALTAGPAAAETVAAAGPGSTGSNWAALLGAAIAVAGTPFLPGGLPVLLALLGLIAVGRPATGRPDTGRPGAGGRVPPRAEGRA